MYLQYYVYAYLRKDGTPYYIGKGKNKRAWSKHSFSIPKDQSQIIILEKNLTEIGALAIERRLIRWHGRKDKGTGILINHSDGGESPIGRICSETEKQKISAANKGKPAWNKGIPRTAEDRAKMSATRRSRIGTPGHNIRPPCSVEKAEKIKIANTGKRWIHKEETQERKLVSLDEFLILCEQGWKPGQSKEF
jgi:hypothetical protein